MSKRARRSSELFLETAMPHVDMLHTLARRLCLGRREDAEDLVQDVMLRAFAAWRPENPLRSMAAWLGRICINTVASAGRRRQARPLEAHDDVALLALAEPTRTEVLALARIEADVIAAAVRLLAGRAAAVQTAPPRSIEPDTAGRASTITRPRSAR